MNTWYYAHSARSRGWFGKFPTSTLSQIFIDAGGSALPRKLNEFKQQEDVEAPTDYYYFSLMQVDSFFYREPDEAEQQEEEEAPATDPEDN